MAGSVNYIVTFRFTLRGLRKEQARLVKTLLSNCTFDRGSLGPTYNKAVSISL
jgi:hypothetical protein